MLTISSLSLIAKKIGFNLIEFDSICSRPYGFVAIFRKDGVDKALNKKYKNEFTEARASIVGALKQIHNNN